MLRVSRLCCTASRLEQHAKKKGTPTVAFLAYSSFEQVRRPLLLHTVNMIVHNSRSSSSSSSSSNNSASSNNSTNVRKDVPSFLLSSVLAAPRFLLRTHPSALQLLCRRLRYAHAAPGAEDVRAAGCGRAWQGMAKTKLKITELSAKPIVIGRPFTLAFTTRVVFQSIISYVLYTRY